MEDKISVIITGSTGMVGEGVLMECVDNENVEKILIINRRSINRTFPKVKEIVLSDFDNVQSVENELAGYNACFFCLGVSSVGMNRDLYKKVTYDLTLNFAKVVSKQNQEMTFIYVSGAGTEGGAWWAKIKRKVELDLNSLPFKKVYGYRPGFIKPYPGQHYSHKFYKYVNWMFPIGKVLYPKGFNTMQELGKSMINLTLKGSPKDVLDGNDIRHLS